MAVSRILLSLLLLICLYTTVCNGNENRPWETGGNILPSKDSTLEKKSVHHQNNMDLFTKGRTIKNHDLRTSQLNHGLRSKLVRTFQNHSQRNRSRGTWQNGGGVRLGFLPGATPEDGNCSSALFPSDPWALWACRAQLALQTNWFPSPISGLFSYQVWNGFDGFWQNGCVLETLANFMFYGGHRRYVTVVRSSLRDIWQLMQAYYPQPSFDDMAWYALSYLRVYEVLGDQDFLQRAQDIYNWNWQQGWDQNGSCSGGMWFDQSQSFKATITNVQMLQLSAKLYQITKNDQYLTQAKAIWQFIDHTKLINTTTWLVADGINLGTCLKNDNYGPTYSSGVLAGGLLHLSKVLNNTGFLDLAHKVANATMTLKSNKDGVLMEPCDEERNCGDDNIVFKGIFVRNLRYLTDISDNVTAAQYQKWIELNSRSLISKDACIGSVSNCKIVFKDGAPYYIPTTPVFDTAWTGPFNHSAPMQQASALDLLVSSIAPGTKCQGAGCDFDPPIPSTPPLTCKDSPCPQGQPCCEFSGGYRTCCTSDQKCINGTCT